VNPGDVIESLAVAQAMREHEWLYPAVAIAHIVGFSILFGSVVMFDLRVLGLSKQISVRALARLLLPWSVASLALIVPTGLLLFAAHADDFLESRVFAIKMALILAAGVNAAMFLTGPYQTVKTWDTVARAPMLARLSVALSIVLWVGVISCGRLIARP
jgi:hypothetical protein